MSDENLEQLDEPEVYVAKLGCPYKLGDPLMDAWLDGFKAGMAEGGRIACRAVEDGFKDRDGG